MTDIRKAAGKSTYEMAEKRRTKTLIFGLAGLGLLIGIAFLINHSTALGIGGIGVLVLLVLMSFLRGQTERAMKRGIKTVRRAERGARAEEQVGALLDTLGADYHVIHDLESPYGNIDHLVIARAGGIFLIETKSHHGKVAVEGGSILVNGRPPEKDFIAQALRNAYWLRDRLGELIGAKPWITPVVVFTNAFVPSMPAVKGVRIINVRFLTGLIRSTNSSNQEAASIWDHRNRIDQL